MASLCQSPGLNSSVCGTGGACILSTDGWRCQCTDPSWTNHGELVNDPSMPCVYNRAGEIAALAVFVTCWVIVLLFAGITAFRMSVYIPYSSRRRAEVILLSMKCFHACLFIAAGLLAISSPDHALGNGFAATLVYALASTFFWVEYKLFLIVSTLSSVTAIARVIAPKPMKVYTMTSPFLLMMCSAVSFSVMAMIGRNPGQEPSAQVIGTLHIGLSGLMGFFLVGSHIVAMTLILRKFKEMQVSQGKQGSKGTPSGGDGASGGAAPVPMSSGTPQMSKLGSVETKIRQLRKETLVLFVSLPLSLLLVSAVPEIRFQTPYLFPLGWGCVALVTCRFIYMSHATVLIHLRRLRTDPTSLSPDHRRLHHAHGGGGEDGFTARDTTDASPFQSNGGEAEHDGARSAISTLAKKRKKKRQKFINMMTRVEEEKTAAMTRVEERFTVVDTNDISQSEKRS